MDSFTRHPENGQDQSATARRSDLVRQVAVIAATCFMLIAAMLGTGLFGGTPVEDVQGGSLDADATPLAPAGPAFSIWSAIYALLIWYTVWQALPRQRTSLRQRNIGWWIALSAVLNGLWLVMARYATLALTVVVIVALLVVLCITFQRTVAIPAESRWDAFLVDVTTGLHLGWVSLATAANTAAWLAASGVRLEPADVWGVVILAAVGLIGVGIAVASRGRFAPSLAIAWGLSWVAVGRLSGEPPSAAIGTAAIVIAAIVLAAPLVMLARRPARRPEAYARVP
jgi:hypothetical protein